MKITINNKYDGRSLEIAFHSGEAAVSSVIDCMRCAYGKGYNYVNPKMFDSDYINSCIGKGDLVPFVGMADTVSAVTVSAIKNSYFDKAWELGAAAVTDGFKGFHLASAAVKYILKYFGNEQLFYAHAVMFYESAGKALEDSGFVPTGFTYGVCDAKKHLTQLNYKSQKHTWAVYIRNNGKNIIKRVYVPARFTQIVEELYNSIGIFPDINLDYHEPTTESRIQLKQDDYHKTLYLYVIKSGFDLHKRIKEAEQKYNGELQSIVLFLSISDRGAVFGLEKLIKAGYKFTGIKPLCAEHEYAIMSKTNSVYIDFNEMKMTDNMKNIFDKINAVNN